MKKRWISGILMACMAAALLSGCKGEEPAAAPEATPEATAAYVGDPELTGTEVPAQTPTEAPTQSPDVTYPMDLSNYPRVDGSTATIPLSMAFAKALTGAQDEDTLMGLANHTGTMNAYGALALYEGADVLLVYQASEEMQKQIASAGVELEMTPIGRDALVFLLNDGNGVVDLSTAQIQEIYGGKIKNWKDVGGTDAEIVAFQRPEDSGSQTLMRKLVMKDVKMMEAPAEYYPSEMEGLIRSVAQYSNTANAIGYSVYYYVSQMFTQTGIKLCAVDGVTPGNDTIKAGQYPFVNDFYCVIRKDAAPDSMARKFYEYVLSADGKRIIEEAGYVGL